MIGCAYRRDRKARESEIGALCAKAKSGELKVDVGCVHGLSKNQDQSTPVP
jgi:hypothetical protein